MTEQSAFKLAERYVGIKELDGEANHPLVQWWNSLCGELALDMPDSIPWCSAFVNGICWELRLPRSKSLRARSWLLVGRVIDLQQQATVGYDVVILRRGTGTQPDATVINAPGHCGFFAGLQGNRVFVLGGNQANSVMVSPYPTQEVLGVRRLA